MVLPGLASFFLSKALHLVGCFLLSTRSIMGNMHALCTRGSTATCLSKFCPFNCHGGSASSFSPTLRLLVQVALHISSVSLVVSASCHYACIAGGIFRTGFRPTAMGAIWQLPRLIEYTIFSLPTRGAFTALSTRSICVPYRPFATAHRQVSASHIIPLPNPTPLLSIHVFSLLGNVTRELRMVTGKRKAKLPSFDLRSSIHADSWLSDMA
jgi:hypothetical protein